MKVLIAYFSGTGNTKMVAKKYQECLEGLSHEVALYELTSENVGVSVDLSHYDLVGIGYPVHAFNAPKIILEFIKAMPKEYKKVFLFKTSGEPVRLNDISSLKAIKLLKGKGYAVDNEYHYVMPYNIIFRHSDEMAYNMWEAAKKVIPLDVEEILACQPHRLKRVFAGGFLAWVMRVEHWGSKLNGKFYKVKADCTHCNLCVKTCPVHNIKLDEKGGVVFGKECIMCMRCAFNCPKNAIEIGLFRSWKVNGKYTFTPPQQTYDSDKHKKYCEKAYKRYFNECQLRSSKANPPPTTEQ